MQPLALRSDSGAESLGFDRQARDRQWDWRSAVSGLVDSPLTACDLAAGVVSPCRSAVSTAPATSADRKSTPLVAGDPSPTAKPLPLDATVWSVDPLTIAMWLVAQLGCLAVVLLHVPLAAVYPPGERLGVEALTAVQIGSAALLAPALARSFGAAAVAIGTVWPAILLAGALAARPVPAALAAAGVVSAWVAAMALLAASFRSPSIRGIVAAAGAIVGIGGGPVAYLAQEFGVSGDGDSIDATTVAVAAGDNWTALLDACPTALAWSVGRGNTVITARTVPLGVFVLAALVLAAWRHIRDRRRAQAR